MTPPEAEALAKRLERVWGGDVMKDSPRGLKGRLKTKTWLYIAEMSWGRDYQVVGTDFHYFVTWEGWVCPSGNLEWLPTFRRNVWLSGAPIEATAHEKLNEWKFTM